MANESSKELNNDKKNTSKKNLASSICKPCMRIERNGNDKEKTSSSTTKKPSVSETSSVASCYAKCSAASSAKVQQDSSSGSSNTTKPTAKPPDSVPRVGSCYAKCGPPSVTSVQSDSTSTVKATANTEKSQVDLVDGSCKVKPLSITNPFIEKMEEDILYHIALGNKSHDLLNMFGDVKFVVMGSTPKRMEQFAYFMANQLKHELAPGTILNDISRNSHRYAMFKVGPILSVSHGMGTPSIGILLHELIKLMSHAGIKNSTFVRIGTCGGFNKKAGTVVVSNKVVNDFMEPFYELAILGKKIRFPASLDQTVVNEMISLSEPEDEFETIAGVTYCTDNFYEGSGRADGAICEFSETESFNYYKELQQNGVVNVEMESLAFAALTCRAGIKSAVVTVVLSDRLEASQNKQSKEVLDEWQTRPQRLLAKYIKKKLSISDSFGSTSTSGPSFTTKTPMSSSSTTEVTISKSSEGTGSGADLGSSPHSYSSTRKPWCKLSDFDRDSSHTTIGSTSTTKPITSTSSALPTSPHIFVPKCIGSDFRSSTSKPMYAIGGLSTGSTTATPRIESTNVCKPCSTVDSSTTTIRPATSAPFQGGYNSTTTKPPSSLSPNVCKPCIGFNTVDTTSGTTTSKPANATTTSQPVSREAVCIPCIGIERTTSTKTGGTSTSKPSTAATTPSPQSYLETVCKPCGSDTTSSHSGLLAKEKSKQNEAGSTPYTTKSTTTSKPSSDTSVSSSSPRSEFSSGGVCKPCRSDTTSSHSGLLAEEKSKQNEAGSTPYTTKSTTTSKPSSDTSVSSSSPRSEFSSGGVCKPCRSDTTSSHSGLLAEEKSKQNETGSVLHTTKSTTTSKPSSDTSLSSSSPRSEFSSGGVCKPCIGVPVGSTAVPQSRFLTDESYKPSEKSTSPDTSTRKPDTNATTTKAGLNFGAGSSTTDKTTSQPSCSITELCKRGGTTSTFGSSTRQPDINTTSKKNEAGSTLHTTESSITLKPSSDTTSFSSSPSRSEFSSEGVCKPCMGVPVGSTASPQSRLSTDASYKPSKDSTTTSKPSTAATTPSPQSYLETVCKPCGSGTTTSKPSTAATTPSQQSYLETVCKPCGSDTTSSHSGLLAEEKSKQNEAGSTPYTTKSTSTSKPSSDTSLSSSSPRSEFSSGGVCKPCIGVPVGSTPAPQSRFLTDESYKPSEESTTPGTSTRTPDSNTATTQAGSDFGASSSTTDTTTPQPNWSINKLCKRDGSSSTFSSSTRQPDINATSTESFIESICKRNSSVTIPPETTRYSTTSTPDSTTVNSLGVCKPCSGGSGSTTLANSRIRRACGGIPTSSDITSSIDKPNTTSTIPNDVTSTTSASNANLEVATNNGKSTIHQIRSKCVPYSCYTADKTDTTPLPTTPKAYLAKDFDSSSNSTISNDSWRSCYGKCSSRAPPTTKPPTFRTPEQDNMKGVPPALGPCCASNGGRSGTVEFREVSDAKGPCCASSENEENSVKGNQVTTESVPRESVSETSESSSDRRKSVFEIKTDPDSANETSNIGHIADFKKEPSNIDQNKGITSRPVSSNSGALGPCCSGQPAQLRDVSHSIGPTCAAKALDDSPDEPCSGRGTNIQVQETAIGTTSRPAIGLQSTGSPNVEKALDGSRKEYISEGKSSQGIDNKEKNSTSNASPPFFGNIQGCPISIGGPCIYTKDNNQPQGTASNQPQQNKTPKPSPETPDTSTTRSMPTFVTPTPPSSKGIICHSKFINSDNVLVTTPGVSIDESPSLSTDRKKYQEGKTRSTGSTSSDSQPEIIKCPRKLKRLEDECQGYD